MLCPTATCRRGGLPHRCARRPRAAAATRPRRRRTEPAADGSACGASRGCRRRLECRIVREDLPLRAPAAAGPARGRAPRRGAACPPGTPRGLRSGGRRDRARASAGERAFTERVAPDESLQLRNDLGFPPEGEIGVDPLFERREAPLLEPRRLERTRRARTGRPRAPRRARGRAPRSASTAASRARRVRAARALARRARSNRSRSSSPGSTRSDVPRRPPRDSPAAEQPVADARRSCRACAPPSAVGARPTCPRSAARATRPRWRGVEDREERALLRAAERKVVPVPARPRSGRGHRTPSRDS